jgi:hypothetical protein
MYWYFYCDVMPESQNNGAEEMQQLCKHVFIAVPLPNNGRTFGSSVLYAVSTKVM